MENKDEVRYFNFPICLIKGFLNDHKKCLADILSYTLYEYVFTRLEIIKKFDSITQKRKGGFKLIYFLGLLQK